MDKAQEYQEQGVKLFNQRDFEAAARAFQQAKESYSELDQADMVAEMQVNLGLVHRALGEHQQALDMMQQALRFFQEADDTRRAAQALGNMGGVYDALNDREQAYNSYRQAADIFLELDEMQLYGQTLLAMGDLQVREGKIMVGAATYQLGLEYIEDLNARQKLMKNISGLITRLTGSGRPAS